MEINGTNSGTALYAMKKSLEMPEPLLDVVQSSSGNNGQNLVMKSGEGESVDLSAFTGKGKLINVVA